MKLKTIRILIIGFSILLVIFGYKLYRDQYSRNPGYICLHVSLVGDSIVNFGGQVLGVAAKRLPQFPMFEKLGISNKLNTIFPTKSESEEKKETLPIKEPIKNIEFKTQDLIESIKKLPQDQLSAIKKQLYKDFCENLTKE